MELEWERICRRLKTSNWLILLILSGVSFLLMPPPFTLGIIAGGFIIMANFHILQRVIFKGFSQDGVLTAKRRTLIGKYYIRLLAMGVAIYLLLSRKWLHPVGLTIGLSTVVLSILGLGISRIWKSSSREAI